MEYLLADNDQKISAAINEILEVCKKHGISISHEDGQGGFVIEDWDEDNARWLRSAVVERISEDTTKTGELCARCGGEIQYGTRSGWTHLGHNPKHKAVPQRS